MFVHTFPSSFWCPHLWPFPSAFVLSHANFKLLFFHIPSLVSAPEVLMWGFQAASCAVLGALGELGLSLCSPHRDQDRKWLQVWARIEPRTCVGLSSSFVSFLMGSPTHCVLLAQLLQQLPRQPRFILAVNTSSCPGSEILTFCCRFQGEV